MSAHDIVLLNFLNKLANSNKMGGLPSILSLLLNKFNRSSNRVQILDSTSFNSFGK